MKKLLAILLIIATLICLLAACDTTDTQNSDGGTSDTTPPSEDTNPPATPVDYDLWIGHVRVTSANQNDVLGDGSVVYVGNNESGTLKLNNANINTTYVPESDEEEYSFGIYTDMESLVLELKGISRLTAENTPDMGIAVNDLTVNGDGTIEVCGNVFGLSATNLVVNSGTVTATSAKNEQAVVSIGIFAGETITVKGGTLNGSAGTFLGDFCYGVYAMGNIEISGGVVNAGLDTAFTAVGLISSAKIKVAGGEVSAYGLDDAINCVEFELANGTVKAESLDFSTDGVCRLVNKFTVGGGSLEAELLAKGETAVPVIFSGDIQFADGFTPSIKAGTGAEFASDISDYASYDYKDVYIVIQ